MIQFKTTASLTEATEKYLIVFANCVEKSIDPIREPLLASVIAKYPHADPYISRNTGQRDRPGTVRLLGGGTTTQRPVLVCFAQYYPGDNPVPNDNQEKRLNWFRQCLSAIERRPLLKSVAFPALSSLYQNLVNNFAKSVLLEQPEVTVAVYGEPPTLPVAPQESPGLINITNVQQRLYRLEQLVSAHQPTPTSPTPTPTSTTTPTAGGRLQISFKEPLVITPSISIVPPKSALPLPGGIGDKQSSTGVVAGAVQPSPSSNPMDKNDCSMPDVMIDPATTVPDNLPSYDENPDWRLPLTAHRIHRSWQPIFQDELARQELIRIDALLSKELQQFGDFSPIYPQPPENIFCAFRTLPLDKVRIVIVGQDPYHNPGEAVGLAFSVPRGVKIPPSLVNIYKEIQSDLAQAGETWTPPTHGDLTAWTEQGVLLLNSALTVRGNKAGSHLPFWEPFTDRILHLLGNDPTHPRHFLLWGNYAQAKATLLGPHNTVLRAAHPSPLSAARGWFGTRHFSQVNQSLQERGQAPIRW